MTDLKCWNCGAPLADIPLPISRHAACPDCFNELHCCRLCRHYEPQRAGAQCAEDRADPPVIKNNANFCDWFDPSASAFAGNTMEKHNSARTRLDDLFGSGSKSSPEAKAPASPSQPQSKEDEVRERLNGLFEADSNKDSPENKV